jgi:phage shock protein A
VALLEEREHMAQAHRRRMAELDAIRRLLESRAGEVEAAHTSLERERARLRSEYEGKVGELTEARARLERQVAKMEGKEAQLRGEWGRFEEEKAAAVAEAEVRRDNGWRLPAGLTSSV